MYSDTCIVNISYIATECNDKRSNESMMLEQLPLSPPSLCNVQMRYMIGA